MHDAVLVRGVEQTEAQTLPPVECRADRITVDGHLLMSQAKHKKVTPCLSPGLEAEIEVFVLDIGDLCPLGIEAIF